MSDANSREDRLIDPPPRCPSAAPSTAQVVASLSSLDTAREALRLDATRQAGFTSERIPHWMFRHRPILFDDGPAHDEHRAQLARFFAPRVLRERHGEFITATADAAVREAVVIAHTAGACRVDEIALHFSVRVASQIVGLTESDAVARSRRLTRFFRQPPVDHTRTDYGRTTRQWITAAGRALGPLLVFHLRDVMPAVRARKRKPRDDIISYLLDRGYGRIEILMECLTYGTAGMVTTREFICAALWHLLREDRLRTHYLESDEAGRHALLHEIIRLEPPVGHLYRRVQGTAEKPAAAPACPYSPGTLIDIHVRDTNTDAATYGPDAGRIILDRDLPASERSGLSFGDGSHRCPGAPLALMETDALILALLRAKPLLRSEPRVEWDTLIEGYQLRDFELSFDAPGAS